MLLSVSWNGLHLDIPLIAGFLEIVVTNAGRAEGIRCDWHEGPIWPLVQFPISQVKGAYVGQGTPLKPQSGFT